MKNIYSNKQAGFAPLGVLLIVLIIGLGGYGFVKIKNRPDQTVSPSVKQGKGTATGYVRVGPTCPGQMSFGKDCNDKPYGEVVIVRSRSTGNEVARFTPDANGYYELSLSAGAYYFTSLSTTGYPITKSPDVTVQEGAVTRYDLTFDSGMR